MTCIANVWDIAYQSDSECKRQFCHGDSTEPHPCLYQLGAIHTKHGGWTCPRTARHHATCQESWAYSQARDTHGWSEVDQDIFDSRRRTWFKILNTGLHRTASPHQQDATVRTGTMNMRLKKPNICGRWTHDYVARCSSASAMSKRGILGLCRSTYWNYRPLNSASVWHASGNLQLADNDSKEDDTSIYKAKSWLTTATQPFRAFSTDTLNGSQKPLTISEAQDILRGESSELSKLQSNNKEERCWFQLNLRIRFNSRIMTGIVSVENWCGSNGRLSEEGKRHKMEYALWWAVSDVLREVTPTEQNQARELIVTSIPRSIGNTNFLV